ncbi:hypothetical protein BDC45DRAFT_531103 [Circinella umbellata]|nr:hypothetical protein BDC45DRAFT_531103 [Circinella umbellata]
MSEADESSGSKSSSSSEKNDDDDRAQLVNEAIKLARAVAKGKPDELMKLQQKSKLKKEVMAQLTETYEQLVKSTEVVEKRSERSNKNHESEKAMANKFVRVPKGLPLFSSGNLRLRMIMTRVHEFSKLLLNNKNCTWNDFKNALKAEYGCYGFNDRQALIILNSKCFA